ncbi:unnamed protein product [Amoebophrya sp. A120]|nr:unnamed protein product [Amoebophrya sp. A120]|eukprot:GSA120T00024144001.1
MLGKKKSQRNYGIIRIFFYTNRTASDDRIAFSSTVVVFLNTILLRVIFVIMMRREEG